MKRLLLTILCCVLLGSVFLIPVSAAEPNSAQVHVTVNTDGSCQVSLQLTLTPDGRTDSIVIPLGPGAKNASLEGVKLKIRKVSGMPSVTLTREGGYSGRQSISLTYTLTGCIKAEAGWRLEVPILAEGLPYALENISFRVTMPQEFEEVPDFISGYHGENVDNYMTVSISGTEITGAVNTTLRDRESLVLRMATNPDVFPRSNEAGNIYPVARIVCMVFLGLMLLYWLIRLRWKITFLGSEQPQPPEGIGAGEICSRLLTSNPDLPLMILSWAQAGYLTIHLDQDNAVTLHKRMDMGNERSDFEGKIFSQLFGYEQIADVTEDRFRQLRASVRGSLPRVRGLFRRKGGRVLWVRVLGACAGFAAGIGMGDMLVASTGGRLLPILLLGLATALASWIIQTGLSSFFCWDLQPGILSLVAAGLVLVEGLLSHCLGFALLLCLGQLVGGALTVFGGQRSEIGRMSLQNILGFRLYLQNVNLKNISRIMNQRPGYYYDMAPYALALGVDRQFAARFGTIRLPDCMWLVCDYPLGNRAPEWYPVLRQVTQIMRGQSSRRDVRPKADVLYEEDFQQ